ncbi:Uncharacterized protein PCOAH_00039570 [Plasmodium coatneyi]|uniref:Uncharacterized protein n=1 Tax=Plasmodium coatneyi TaxID=208452 RepID=A0A1B1E5E6_9APIC|nr:Uncharacterized protein PCOAH_00039570 [Plasmodium coatneyi]ANQ09999.1 Uncharacterized protein PCOAH_00039570 [Plasmodium coatneyi]
MPVTKRQNKKGKKGGAVFRFCTKASVYTLLVWIVNCSNTSQYGGNSYNVMNNGLGKAVDSRTLRLLAEAYEEAIEEEGETTGEVGTEEEVVEKAPSLSSIEEEVVHEVVEEVAGAIEEDEETSGDVGAKEQVVQKAPSLSSLEEEVVQKAPSPSSVQKTVAQASKNVGKTSGKVPKQLLRKKKFRINDLASILVRPTYIYDQPELLARYEQQRLNIYKRKRPTITEGEDEDLIKNVNLFNTRDRALQGDPSAIAEYPKGYWDPFLAYQRALKELLEKHNEYREMLANNFYNVKFIDNFDNSEALKRPYYEREYGRLDLSPAPPRLTTKKVEEEKKYEQKEEIKTIEKKKTRRRLCCF